MAYCDILWYTKADYHINSGRETQFRQWATKVLDAFLQFSDADILQDKGRVTAEIAKFFAESEFEQYCIYPFYVITT